MRIAAPVFGASANWPVVAGLTNCTLPTRLVVAGINANVVNAGLVVWTLWVMLAFPSFDCEFA